MTKKILLVMVFICELAYCNPILNQTGYRWRNDDGNEVNASYKENVNTASIVSYLDEVIRLRIAIQETNNEFATVSGNSLQYKKSTSATWLDITEATTGDFYLVNSDFVVNNQVTSQQVSSGGFAAGRIKSNNINVVNVGIDGTSTEYEFVIRTSNTYDENETYEFRVNGLNNYSVTPTLNPNMIFCRTIRPTISNSFIIYEVGDTAVPLTATGSNLLWYTSEFGGSGASVAPTPDTSTAGSTSYWVSQTDNGCESLRTKIEVLVRSLDGTGRSLHFDGVNDYAKVTNFDYSNPNTFTLDFWVKPEKTITIPSESTSGITGSSNQSYAIFPTLPSLFLPVVDAENTMAGVSVGTNGIVVFEHHGGHLPALLSWTGTVTDWTRVTVVFDNKEPSLYVNGTFIKTGLASTILNVYPGTRDFGNSDDLTHNGYGPFQGSLDKLYILNKAIIPSSECEPAPAAADIIASYDFGNGTAGGDNSTVDYLFDETNAYHAELYDFALNGATSNWLGDSYNGQFNLATVTSPVIYDQGAMATQLTASTGENGLLWYDNANGGVGSITAPTPDTSAPGNTSYWVASTTVDGCESERSEIVVQVNQAAPATQLHFDGINDAVDLGSGLTSYFTGRTAFTLEAWVRPETSSGLGLIVGNYDYPSTNLGMQMMLRKDNNGYAVWLDTGAGFVNVTQQNAVVVDTWQHVAGVWDGTTVSLYIDGALVNSTNLSGTLPSISTNFVIGDNAQPVNEGFNGDIDEVRIWDIARSSTAINSSKNCELIGTESGLVAYYKFNQGNSGVDNSAIMTLNDATANANNGTFVNFALSGATSNFLEGSPVETGVVIPEVPIVTTPVMYNQGDSASQLTATGSNLLWYTSATGGSASSTAPTPDTSAIGSTSYWVSSSNANGCESDRTEIVVSVVPIAIATHLNFDGVNDVVNLGTSLTSTLNNANFFTVEALINVPNVSGVGSKTIIGNHSGGGGTQFDFRIIDDTLNGFIGFGSYSISSPAGSISANTWHHVAMVYNDTTLKLFIDGIEVANTNVPLFYSLQNSTQPYAIGDAGFANEIFIGDIDEVRVWNVARSASELLNNKDCELASNELGLIRYYNFNNGLAAEDNTGLTTLTDVITNANNGALANFALTGATSNWLAGSPVTSYCNTLNIQPKVLLQGAALNPNTGEESLMRDDLRVAGYIPTTSPYVDAATCNASVFAITGANAIVDWVWLELRDETTNTSVIYSTSALLQRDGDVVATDGVSPITLNGLSGNYYVAIKHRNHLGIMSENVVALSSTSTLVDFSNMLSPITFGANAQTSNGLQSNKIAMWAGNVNGDSIIQYSGANPDSPSILSNVLNDSGNFLNFPTYIVSGYNSNDVNMDGNTQYSGTSPDTPFILQNVLFHPDNFLNFSTFQIQEQLPEN